MTIQPSKVELRGLCDRDLVDVIDALAIARGIDSKRGRMAVIEPVLREWVERISHEAMIIQRVTKNNGSK